MILSGVFLLVLLLVGCGYKANTSGNMGEPDTLKVARVNMLQKVQPAPDFDKEVKNAAVVRELYVDMLKLPPFPQGIFNCPVDFGIRYDLTFMQGNRVILKAVADPGGCRGIRLASGKELWGGGKKGEPFWTLLRKALGLSEKQFLCSPGPK